MKQKPIRIFSDEVGPTGLDLLNRDQPFFIASYLVIDDKAEEKIEDRVRQLLKSTTAPKELKFTKLSNSSAGMRMVVSAMEALNNADTEIHFAIIEKRFQACTLVVETFLDAKTHPRSLPQHELREWRTWLANEIYAATTDDLLTMFIRGMKERSPDAVRDAGRQMASRLALHPNNDVRFAARLMEEGLQHFFQFGDPENASPSAPLPTSPVSAFLPAVLSLSQALAKKSLTGEIICDTDLQSGPALNQALELARNPEIFSSVFKEFTGPDSTPPVAILGRAEVDSTRSLPVQLADLVAGLINRVAIMRTRSTSRLETKLSKAWDNLHPCIERGMPHQFVMLSEKLQQRRLLVQS